MLLASRRQYDTKVLNRPILKEPSTIMYQNMTKTVRVSEFNWLIGVAMLAKLWQCDMDPV